MISSDDITSYFSNPNSIPEQAVADLGSLSEKYPYCNSLHLLYLKGLSLHQGIDFEEVLQLSSAHALNREHLYFLITGQDDIGVPSDEETEVVTVDEVTEVEVEGPVTEDEGQVTEEEVEFEQEEEDITEETEAEENSDSEEDEMFELGADIIAEVTTAAYELETEEIIQEEPGEVALEETEDGSSGTDDAILEVKEDEGRINETMVEDDQDYAEASSDEEFEEDSADEEQDYVETSSDEEIDYENLTFIQWLKLKQGRPIDEEEDVYFDSDEEDEDLVDKFIREEPSISRPTKAAFYDPVKNAKESLLENSDIVTETLAEVHIQQKNFGKAIETYEQLMALYPEKKAIFATRIEEINARLR